jgi:hypothetical protein
VLPFNEQIYYTTNSGTNWILANYPSQLRAITQIQFINSSTVYACGAENVSFNPSKKHFLDFNSIPLFTRNKIIRTGNYDITSEYKGAFIKSTNSGLTWVRASQFDTTTDYINAIQFFNANTGYALFSMNNYPNAGFFRTTNSGTNWQQITTLALGAFYDNNMYFIDVNTGYVCGMANYIGTIYKTTNAGVNWTSKAFPYTDDISGIIFFNSATGVAVGNGGTVFIGTKIFRTTNSGNNWDSITSVNNIIPDFIKVLPGTGTAFASGYPIDTPYFARTYTMKSTDYGLTWVIKNFITYRDITGCSLIDQNNFFMSGGDMNVSAVILKSTNGGNVFINQSGNGIPDNYSLYQNYPNPFNPSTTIKFDITNNPLSRGVGEARGVLTRLKVFDITGREVSTLINEHLSSGTYEVSFNSGNLPSGTYFYRLETENFSQTKTMLLIK